VQKITPYLWFDSEAEEAATYYTSIFKNSRIVNVNRIGEGGPLPAGTVVTATFEIDGQQFVALNGNPQPNFTESTSLYVDCEDQAEVDELWSRLTEGGGEPGQCGWLKDKYGVSWQIIPTALGELMSDSDPEKSSRVVQAMLGMKKIDIQGLRDAYEGRG
jgi:predicted 3-demethylubiquinone-9 3-methyltransferase (glyoxalase superfamily)